MWRLHLQFFSWFYELLCWMLLNVNVMLDHGKERTQPSYLHAYLVTGWSIVAFLFICLTYISEIDSKYLLQYIHTVHQEHFAFSVSAQGHIDADRVSQRSIQQTYD